MRYSREKQLLFAQHYLENGRDGLAALRKTYPSSAGWKDSAQRAKVSELLRLPVVKEMLAQHQAMVVATVAVETGLDRADWVRRMLKTWDAAEAAGDFQAAVVAGKVIGEAEGFYEERMLKLGLTPKGDLIAPPETEQSPAAFVDAPPQETYEEWMARNEGANGGSVEPAAGAAGGGDPEDLG